MVAVEDGGELGGVGAAPAEEVEDGEGADPGPEVAAGDLAGHAGVAGDVQQVVAELEGPPDPLAELGQRVHHRWVGPAREPPRRQAAAIRAPVLSASTAR